MLDIEVLVGECFGAVDSCATGTVAVEEISSLDHETFDLSSVKIVPPKAPIKHDMIVLTTRWNLQPL